MNTRVAALSLVVLSASASAASANNEMILLDPTNLSQHAIIEVIGDNNRLVIEQFGQSGQGGNTAQVSITGSGNGDPIGARFTGAAAKAGIDAGSLRQQGFGNDIQVAVVGDSNLFALSQMGSNSSVLGSVTGNSNQAAVMQVGVGNFTSFTQSGFGNNISVQQTSW